MDLPSLDDDAIFGVLASVQTAHAHQGVSPRRRPAGDEAAEGQGQATGKEKERSRGSKKRHHHKDRGDGAKKAKGITIREPEAAADATPRVRSSTPRRKSAAEKGKGVVGEASSPAVQEEAEEPFDNLPTDPRGYRGECQLGLRGFNGWLNRGSTDAVPLDSFGAFCLAQDRGILDKEPLEELVEKAALSFGEGLCRFQEILRFRSVFQEAINKAAAAERLVKNAEEAVEDLRKHAADAVASMKTSEQFLSEERIQNAGLRREVIAEKERSAGLSAQLEELKAAVQEKEAAVQEKEAQLAKVRPETEVIAQHMNSAAFQKEFNLRTASLFAKGYNSCLDFAREKKGLDFEGISVEEFSREMVARRARQAAAQAQPSSPQPDANADEGQDDSPASS